MRIDRLELTNFRCFERATLSFAPGFNVLIGENGAGKTAVLDALASGLDHAIDGLNAPRRGPPAGVFRAARLVAHEHEGAVSLEAQYPMSFAWHGEINGTPCLWTDTESAPPTLDPAGVAPGAPSHDDVRVTTPSTEQPRALFASLARSVRGGSPTTLPVVAYYPSKRLWTVPGPVLGEAVGPESRLRGYEHWATPDARAHTLVEWFRWQEQISLQERKEPELLTAAREAIRGCVEGCTEVRFVFRYRDLMVRFAGDAWMPFSLLSDGQRGMCALVGELAYRCALLNPHLGARAARETPGVVLIDELDLHLHPRWQRRVVDDLRRTFPRVQFFATTHSPLVLAGLSPGEVILLERDAAGNVTSEKPDEDPRLLTASQLNRDFFGIPGIFPTELAARYRRYGVLAGTPRRSDDEEVEVQRLYEGLRAARVEVEPPEPRVGDDEKGTAKAAS